MRRRRKAPPAEPRCRDCGARVYFAPKDSRETNRPLDPHRPIYVDLDGDPSLLVGYSRHGYAVRGQVARDLSGAEQRTADSGYIPNPGDGVRRIAKCYPLHACEPGAGDPAAPPPSVLGGADRAAGERVE